MQIILKTENGQLTQIYTKIHHSPEDNDIYCTAYTHNLKGMFLFAIAWAFEKDTVP